MDFEVIATALAALAGFFAASATALSTRREMRDAKNAVKRIHESSPDAAISSLDLASLGTYIYGTLGSIPITEYASNNDARRDVARALDQIERFVTDEESVPTRGLARERTAEQWLAEAHRTLATQDTWQGLAQLRRSIEIELRSLARQHEVDVPANAGAGRLLNALVKSEVLPSDLARELRQAIAVANRAIHGDEISPAVAEDALYSAARVLGVLGAR